MKTDILTDEENGKFTLPAEIIERFRFKKETRFRIVETQNGILLVPLNDKPMNGELKTELEQWQTIGAESWKIFH